MRENTISAKNKYCETFRKLKICSNIYNDKINCKCNVGYIFFLIANLFYIVRLNIFLTNIVFSFYRNIQKIF